MLSAAFEKLIRDQIGLELRAERFYLQSSLVASMEGFDSFGKFLRNEAKQEQYHADCWTKFAEAMDIKGEFPVVQDPAPATLHDAIRDAGELERLLLEHMNEIYFAAHAEKILPAVAFLLCGCADYAPISHQQQSIAEWAQRLRRLETKGIADVVAALEN